MSPNVAEYSIKIWGERFGPHLVKLRITPGYVLGYRISFLAWGDHIGRGGGGGVGGGEVELQLLVPPLRPH